MKFLRNVFGSFQSLLKFLRSFKTFERHTTCTHMSKHAHLHQNMLNTEQHLSCTSKTWSAKSKSYSTASNQKLPLSKFPPKFASQSRTIHNLTLVLDIIKQNLMQMIKARKNLPTKKTRKNVELSFFGSAYRITDKVFAAVRLLVCVQIFIMLRENKLKSFHNFFVLLGMSHGCYA